MNTAKFELNLISGLSRNVCQLLNKAKAREHWEFSGDQKMEVNSLVPGKSEGNFRYLIFQIISVIDGWAISCELALICMSLDLTDGKSTLDQVMAWWCQATSHYLSQCWPSFLSPYGVTRPQWVNMLNRFKDYKRYIHILNHNLDLAWSK